MPFPRVSQSESIVKPFVGIIELNNLPDIAPGAAIIFCKSSDSLLYYKDKLGNSYKLINSFKGWGYQDFTAGTITSTSLTLSVNTNGTDITFSSENLINNSAIIRLKSNEADCAYSGVTKLFSTKVEVSSHTGANVTLNAIPHSSWGDIRVYYYYSYVSGGVPTGYTFPSKAVSGEIFNEIDALFITEEELTSRLSDLGLEPTYLSQLNKAMQANVTSTNGDKATNTTMAAIPTVGSYVAVAVNGILKEVGDGVSTKDCYFGIADTTVPRSISTITIGDTLRWNGSIAGYQLDTKDKIDFNYIV